MLSRFGRARPAPVSRFGRARPAAGGPRRGAAAGPPNGRGALRARGVEVRRYAVSLRGARDRTIARWRAPARLAQEAWRRLDGPSIARLTGPVDVVHGTNFVLPSTGGAPGVVTVH